MAPSLALLLAAALVSLFVAWAIGAAGTISERGGPRDCDVDWREPPEEHGPERELTDDTVRGWRHAAVVPSGVSLIDT